MPTNHDYTTWDGINLLKVYPGSGAPHEHAEERARLEATIETIESDIPVMVELGAFWALWSIVFGKKFPDAKLVIVEGNLDKLAVGLNNLYLNGLSAIAHYNTVNAKNTVGDYGFRRDVVDITLGQILAYDKIDRIDLLHMDIQGAEYGIYNEVCDKMREDRIGNVVMATHFPEQHEEMLREFGELGHHIAEFPPDKKDGEIICSKRPWKESNPQPAVLKTAALPIEPQGQKINPSSKPR